MTNVRDFDLEDRNKILKTELNSIIKILTQKIETLEIKIPKKEKRIKILSNLRVSIDQLVEQTITKDSIYSLELLISKIQTQETSILRLEKQLAFSSDVINSQKKDIITLENLVKRLKSEFDKKAF